MKIARYNELMNKYILKYQTKLRKIRKYYFSNIDSMSSSEVNKVFTKYRDTVKKFIIELIDEFAEFKKYKFAAFMNGSFSRETNTLFSDIDINFFYNDNSDLDEKINYEFIINHIIEKVLDYRGMDRIHTMVIYLPLISNKKYIYLKYNKYPMFFEDGELYFSCRENGEKLMYELYNSTRSIYDVINYLNNNDNIDKLNEWANCFELLYDNGIGNVFFENRVICKNTSNIKMYIKKCLDRFNNDTNYLDLSNDNVTVCHLKYCYKGIVLGNIYNMFAIFLRNNKNINMLSVGEFRKNKEFNREFYAKLYVYLKYLDKLSIKLDKYDLDLSSHCFKEINVRKYNIINLIKKLNKLKKELYDICINILLDLEMNV